MKKILLISDCSDSQICGVQRKQNELKKQIDKREMKCLLINSDDFYTFRAPYWRDVKLVLPTPFSYIKLKRLIDTFDPDNICFMTEGTLGIMGIIHCIMTGRKFTTMRCTRFEEYFNYSICKVIIEKYIDIFHKYSECCISPSVKLAELNNHKRSVGILNGCDTKNFSSEGDKDTNILKNKKPLWLYVGRITEEKNIKEILKVSKLLDGTFIFVGDGPLKKILIGENIVTLGWKIGKDLERIYRSCDIFIFPSKTDTFGQVIVEALASGLPVAAYDTYGPNDNESWLIPYLIKCFLNEKTPHLTSCEQIWDFLHIYDAVKAIILLHKSDRTGVYNLGSNKPRPLKKYISIIRENFEKNIKPKFGIKPYRPDQVEYLYPDISKITSDLNWKPVISFNEGIKELINKKKYENLPI